MLLLLVAMVDTNCSFTEETNLNLGKDLLAERTLLADQKRRGWVNYISSPSEVRLTVRAGSTLWKKKLTAEEQDTDRHCSERKAYRRKWLVTLCLLSDRHECALHGNLATCC